MGDGDGDDDDDMVDILIINEKMRVCIGQWGLFIDRLCIRIWVKNWRRFQNQIEACNEETTACCKAYLCCNLIKKTEFFLIE